MSRPQPHINHEEKLEAGLLGSTSPEKRDPSTQPGSSPVPVRRGPFEKMPPARYFVLTFAVCFLVTFSLASVIAPRGGPCLEKQKHHRVKGPLDGPTNDFSDLEPDMLHKLLHVYFPERYRHGIYPSDDKALEAVRSDDAELATSLAKLAKRQNETSVPPASSTESSPPPASSTPPPDSSTPPPPPPSSSQPPPTTNPPPPPPQTTTSEPPLTGATDPPPPPATSNPPPPQNSETTSPNPPNPGTTSGPGRTITSTTSPTTFATSSPVRSTITSTLSNGDVVIITSTSYVGVNPTPVESGTSPKTSAGLQNAAIQHRGHGGIAAFSAALVGGIVGGIMMVF